MPEDIASIGFRAETAQLAEANRQLAQMPQHAQAAARGATQLGAANDNLSRSLGMMHPRLAQATSLLTAFSHGGIAAGAAVGATAVAISGLAIPAFARFEVQLKTTEALLRTTGGAAGVTAEQIEDMAQDIGKATLASTVEVRNAANMLLTFRSISGQVFRDTLETAQDLAAVGFGSITSATVQLARALEDPERGMTALRRSGIMFTQDQQRLIRTLRESGDILGSQIALMRAVRQQVGGAGRAQGETLAGAWDALTESMARWLERTGESIARITRLSSVLNTLADSVENVNRRTRQDPLRELDRLEALIGPNVAITLTREDLETGRAMREMETNRKAEIAQLDLATQARKGFIDKLREEYEERKKLADVESSTLNQSIGVQEAARRELTLLNEAKKAQVAVTPELAAKIRELSQAYGTLSQNRAREGIRNEIEWQYRILGLTQEQVAVVERLRDLYGNDIQRALQSQEGQHLRNLDLIRQQRDEAVQLGQGIGRAFITGLRGGDMGKAFQDLMWQQAGRQLDKLIETAITGLFGVGKPDGSMWNPIYVRPAPGGLFDMWTNKTPLTMDNVWKALTGAGGGPSGAVVPGMGGFESIPGQFSLSAAGGVSVSQLAQAIAMRESGMNYGAIGPYNATLGYPLGAYQVMSANVGPWSQKWYGQQLTPQQFLANPQAQDIIAQGQLGEYMNKGGSWQWAAGAWHGGPGWKPGNMDVLGTSTGNYINDIGKNLEKLGGTTANVTVGLDAMNSGLDSATSSLGNWTQGLSESLSKMFSGGGGGFGSVFSGLGSFGGGSAAGAMSGWEFMAFSAHRGGVVGSGLDRRWVHASHFNDAPRMHNGGGIDWAGGERPVVAMKGEIIAWPEQIARMGSNEFSITINAQGSALTEQQWRQVVREELLPQVRTMIDNRAGAMVARSSEEWRRNLPDISRKQSRLTGTRSRG